MHFEGNSKNWRERQLTRSKRKQTRLRNHSVAAMPQRGVAFSGKQKRQQLQAKHERRRHQQEEHQQVLPQQDVQVQEGVERRGRRERRVQGRDRFALHFKADSESKLAELKALGNQRVHVASHSLHYNVDDFHSTDLALPSRPEWSRSESKGRLETREREYFDEYVRKIDEILRNNDKLDLNEEGEASYYERNLETWRQLWRVLEMATIIVGVVDVRYAPATFPLALYNHLREQNKSMVLVLNKVDLIPRSLAAAWRLYFENRFPALKVTFCSSCTQENLVSPAVLSGEESLNQLKSRRMRARLSMVRKAAHMIVDACESLMAEWPSGSPIDLSSWRTLINTGASSKKVASDSTELVLGIVGQPNAGKSSLINALFGQKLVSVSKTPGHTKHFQTHYICHNVKLCDSPGLVFPSRVPKPLQVAMGSFPISQTRAPLYCVRYILQRIDLPAILNLEKNKVPKEEADKKRLWSPFELCEELAKKREMYTAKGSRPDVNRAANLILRMTLDGKITLALRPKEEEEIESEKSKKEEYIRAIEDMLGIGQFARAGEDKIDEELEGSSEEETATSNKFGALLVEKGEDNSEDSDN